MSLFPFISNVQIRVYITNNDIDMIYLLCSHGYVNIKKYGTMYLNYAIETRHNEIVHLLLSYGVRPNRLSVCAFYEAHKGFQDSSELYMLYFIIDEVIDQIHLNAILLSNSYGMIEIFCKNISGKLNTDIIHFYMNDIIGYKYSYEYINVIKKYVNYQLDRKYFEKVLKTDFKTLVKYLTLVSVSINDIEFVIDAVKNANI